MEINNFKLGADPELFLSKDGKTVSAEGLVGGTKHEPKFISEEGHAIQEDNVMVEFNIPPSESAEEFVYNINHVKEYLTVLANLHDCTLDISASATLDKKYLRTSQAKMFGCEPDFNVYLKEVNDPPEPSGQLRTAGGHIHVGYDNPSQENSELIVYAMDMLLGLESLSLDKDTKRRSMYGNAGSFRFKDYGVEYRTLSNFWIQNDKLTTWAYNKTIEAIQLVNDGIVPELVEEFGEAVKKAIDTNNSEEGNQLLIKIKQKIKNKVCI